MIESIQQDPDITREQNYAALFEAISHPTRIRIIKALFIRSMGFAELKHVLEITGNGTLQHHLQKIRMGTILRLRMIMYRQNI